MSKKQIKCVIYARFSPRPAKALKDCQSIAVQIESCKAFAEKQGYRVMNTYVDQEKSRNDFDRPGLHEGIKSLYRGWIFLAYSPDRIGSGRHAAVIENDIISKGARIEYATGDMNGQSDETTLMRGFFSLLAEYERAKIGRRTSDGMQFRQANGERMTSIGTLPYGKMVDPENDRRMIDNPDEIRVIRAIKRWNKQGVTVAGMISKLHENQWKPRGKEWHRTTINRILARSKGDKPKDS